MKGDLVMALVIRMKYVSRSLLFMGGLILWMLALTLLNEAMLDLEEEPLLGLAIIIGGLQTWALAVLLRT